MNKVEILIMAAGSSSRLGQPKQLLSYKNGTLLTHTIKECLASGLGKVSVILGANKEIIQQSLQEGCTHFLNPNWEQGLGNSIAFGVKQIRNKNLDGIIIVLGDQPFFTRGILHQLVQKKTRTNAPIVLCKYENDQGPPTYFCSSLFQELMDLEGDDGAKAVVQKYKDQVKEIAFEKGCIDIDKPEDLKWLLKMREMKKTIADYKVFCEFPVHWGQMDAAQHVNNLIYLRWSESARIEFFEKMGMKFFITSGSVGPILGWQDCKYIFPITFPDTVLVGTKVVEILKDRFILESGIFSKTHNRIAAITQQSIIPYDYKNLKKVSLPEEWLAGIRKM